MRGSRKGDRGSGRSPPLKIYKNIGFLSNTGLDPPKNNKATKPTFKVGPSSARQRTARSAELKKYVTNLMHMQC